MAEKSLEERLWALPICLRIAFAVRCARRVQPKTNQLPLDHVRGIDLALSTMERAAQMPKLDFWAARDAHSLTRAARTSARRNGIAADALAAALAVDVAVDAYAVQAYITDANAAYTEAYEYTGPEYSAAFIAYANAETAYAATAAAAGDIMLLEEMASRHVIVVDPTEAGPLGNFWSESNLPAWYPPRLAELKSILKNESTSPLASTPPPHTAPSGETPPQELVFEFCVPDDFDEAQMQAVVGKLALSADAYYRSLGGPGLTVDSIELEQPVMEVVP